MKIITVVNAESDSPIHVYTGKCTHDMIYDVETVFGSLGIEVGNNIIKECANDLNKGRTFWFEEYLGFEVIEVKM